jgi:hypothetical protein
VNVQKQIRELLQVRHAPRASSWDRTADILDWEAVGYRGVFSATLFLSVLGHRRWLEQDTLAFPNECCRCGQPATAQLDFRPFLGLPLIRVQSRRAHVRRIPHCQQHAGPQPLAFASVSVEPERYAHALVVGMHRPFLERCLALNRQDGEPPAPWVAFPASRPFGGFNQGTNEHWMRHSWLPFWSDLSPEARQDYLTHNEAPQPWREWIEEFAAHVSNSATSAAPQAVEALVARSTTKK